MNESTALTIIAILGIIILLIIVIPLVKAICVNIRNRKQTKERLDSIHREE